MIETQACLAKMLQWGCAAGYARFRRYLSAGRGLPNSSANLADDVDEGHLHLTSRDAFPGSKSPTGQAAHLPDDIKDGHLEDVAPQRHVVDLAQQVVHRPLLRVVAQELERVALRRQVLLVLQHLRGVWRCRRH